MEEARILELLGGFRRRYRLVRMGAAAARGALYGGLAAALLALGLKLAGFDAARVAWALVPLLVGPLAGALAVIFAPVPELSVARHIDRRAGLHERVSTAVEWILERRGQTLMSRAQLRDAVGALEPLQPRVTFPRELPRRAAWALPLALSVVVLVAIPRWTLFGAPPLALAPPDLTRPAEAVEQAAEALAPRTPDAPPMPELARTADELKELARDMRQGQMSEREALSRLAEAREAVERSLEDARRQAEDGGEGKGAGDKGGKQDAQAAAPGAATPQAAEPPKGAAGAKGQRPMTAAEKEARRQAREALSKKAGALEKAAGRLDQARSCVNGQLAQNQGEAPAAQPNGNGPQANAPDKEGGAAPVPNTGQATKPGQGNGEADFGKGTTNRQQEGQAIKARKTVLERQSAEHKRWTVAYKKLYTAERKQLPSAPTKVKGDRTDQGESTQTTEQVQAAPDAGGGSAIEEQDVYVDARRRAEESMARETVPEEYRDLVRGYFEEINPGASRRQEQ